MLHFPKDRWGRSLGALIARLQVLEIGCADVDATAAFYERAMGYVLERRDRAVAVEEDVVAQHRRIDRVGRDLHEPPVECGRNVAGHFEIPDRTLETGR